VQISTKLNRSHLVTGRDALILPCLGRTEIDLQAEGPQGVTVEDTFSMVHISNGQLRRARRTCARSRDHCRHGQGHAGQPADRLGLAVADYNRIRDMIADVIPGFTGFNERLQAQAVSTWATRRRSQLPHGHGQGPLHAPRAARRVGQRQGTGPW
jgi:hypothetical protein